MTTEERLRSLLVEATEQPWTNDGDAIRAPDDDVVVYAVELANSTADAALIVEAVNALPKLLAVVAASRPVGATLEDLRNAGFVNSRETRDLETLRAALAALDAEP